MNIRKHVPNTITCLSLVSGCISCVMALQDNLQWAAIWIIIAAVLDFLDGLAARTLKAFSPIGKDLDSLADVVSFGVAPGMMVFSLLRIFMDDSYSDHEWVYFLPYLAFIIPAFSALRLAKFNNDTRQTTSFIGLPVPAHALLWSSIVYSLQDSGLEAGTLFFIPGILIGITITSFLLVSEIPMFSLKVKSLSWKGNELRYLLIVSSVLLIILLGFLGIACTIILYILLSIFNRKS